MQTETHFKAPVSESLATLNKNIKVLLNLSALTVKARDLRELLEESLKILLTSLDFFGGRIYFPDPSNEFLLLKAWMGISPDSLERVGFHDSFTGKAALQRSFLAQKVEELRNTERKKTLIAKGIKAVVCIPMIYGDELVGVINLSSNKQLKLRKGYVELLCAVGNQIGITIKCLKTIEQLNDKTTQLKKEEEMRRFFTYCITHDLKNPSGAIIALIKRLLEKSLNREKLATYLTQIYNASLQIYNLVQDLNSYIISKELPLTEEEILLDELIKDVIDRYSKELNDRKISVNLDISAPIIKGDRNQIKRVLLNLIDNSLKYGGPNMKCISISSEQSKGSVMLRVKDDGVGLREEEFSTLFDPFQRKSSAKGVEGSGLGLAIVKSIVERHGGNVFARRPPEGGIEFCLEFPNKD